MPPGCSMTFQTGPFLSLEKLLDLILNRWCLDFCELRWPCLLNVHLLQLKLEYSNFNQIMCKGQKLCLSKKEYTISTISNRHMVHTCHPASRGLRLEDSSERPAQACLKIPHTETLLSMQSYILFYDPSLWIMEVFRVGQKGHECQQNKQPGEIPKPHIPSEAPEDRLLQTL